MLEDTRTLADICLTLSTRHYATKPLLQEVISKTSHAIQICKKDFFSSLNKCNFSYSEKKLQEKKFSDIFRGFTDAVDEKKGVLRNTYNRKLFYCKNLSIILPVELPLLDKDGADSGRHYSYVPILDTLGLMLCNLLVREYCENSPESTNLSGHFDISHGKVVLSQDAFEICNPLGASMKKFEIVAVYMIFINIPSYLRCKVDNIKLVLLCLEEYITPFGWAIVMQKVVDDLKFLEVHGITISVEGNVKTFLRTLISMLCDNLGSHQIGGYTENFSVSLNFSRYCEIL